MKIDFNKIESKRNIELNFEEYIILKNLYLNSDNLIIKTVYKPTYNYRSEDGEMIIEEILISSNEKDKELNKKIEEQIYEIVKMKEIINGLKDKIYNIKKMSINQFKKYKKGKLEIDHN